MRTPCGRTDNGKSVCKSICDKKKPEAHGEHACIAILLKAFCFIFPHFKKRIQRVNRQVHIVYIVFDLDERCVTRTLTNVEAGRRAYCRLREYL